MAQQEYQLFSTLILNAFPLLVCLFITFFGRFFDDLLRIISIFFIVAVPIGAEVLRPWLAGQPLALSNLEPIDATALVWSLVAGYTAAYVAARRKAFGARLQMVGVAFAGIMLFNSFFIGHLHEAVKDTLPGFSKWFDWFNFVFVILTAVALMWARTLPLAGEIVASAVCATIGGFMTLQQITYIARDLGWGITQGLTIKDLLSEEFGCVHDDCTFLMVLMLIITAMGAVNQYAMFKHHLEALRETKSKLTLPKCLAPTVRIYDNLEHHMHRLFNLNAVIETLSKGLARDEERKLELELQHDVYRVAGMVVDAYLVVFSVGFAIHIAEMNFAGVFSDSGTANTVPFLLMVLSVLCLFLAGFAMVLRFAEEEIGSEPWQVKSKRYIRFVAVLWPMLLAAYVFSATIGGEEVAMVNIPYVNQWAGFDKLPQGCDNILQENQEISASFCTWAGGKAGVGTSSIWEERDYLAPGGNQTMRLSKYGIYTQSALVEDADTCAMAAAMYVASKPGWEDQSEEWGATWEINENGGSCHVVWGMDSPENAERPAPRIDTANPENSDTHQTCALARTKNGGNSIARVGLDAERKCRDGMMNYGESGVDCRREVQPAGAKCSQCDPCACAMTGLSGDVQTPFTASDNNVCGNHLNGTDNQENYVYVCYVLDPANCDNEQSARSGYPNTTFVDQGAQWKFCNPLDNEAMLAQEVSECDEDAVISAVPERRDVWFCDAGLCYACNTPACYGDKCDIYFAVRAFFPQTVRILFGITVASLGSMVTVSGELGGFYLFATRLTTYITLLNLIQGLILVIFGINMESQALGDIASGGSVESLIEGEASIYILVIVAGCFLVLQSLIGLLGVKFEQSKVGGGCLRVYLYSILVTVVMFFALFGGACYYVMNIEDYIDDDWETKILPEIQADDSELLDGIAKMSKDDFVEYAKGSFRLLYIIGAWFVGYSSLLFAVTRYMVNMRTSDEAAQSRESRAGVRESVKTVKKKKKKDSLNGAKMSNPMYENDSGEESPGPLTEDEDDGIAEGAEGAEGAADDLDVDIEQPDKEKKKGKKKGKKDAKAKWDAKMAEAEGGAAGEEEMPEGLSKKEKIQWKKEREQQASGDAYQKNPMMQSPKKEEEPEVEVIVAAEPEPEPEPAVDPGPKPERIDAEDYSKMKGKELEAACKKRELQSSGNKKKLTARLEEYDKRSAELTAEWEQAEAARQKAEEEAAAAAKAKEEEEERQRQEAAAAEAEAEAARLQAEEEEEAAKAAEDKGKKAKKKKKGGFSMATKLKLGAAKKKQDVKDEELDDQVDEMVQTVVKLKAKGKKKLALGTPRLHHRPFKDRWAHAWCVCVQTRA